MSQRKTTFGLTLSNRAVVTRGTRPKDLIDMAVRAEASGRVDAVWVGDSILSKPRLECIPLLGAIAGHTSRLRLGVACMATIAQRNPVLLALQWSSLDVLSGGRTWLAACMGYPASQHPSAAKELEVMGIASKERPGRLEEMIQALRVLWSDEHASFHGKYYSFEDVDLLPKPIQQPCPIYIAGTPRATSIGERGVERSLRRIARYADGWMTNQIELPLLHNYLKRLREMLAEEGRDPEQFKTVCTTASALTAIRSKLFARPRHFSTPIISRTFHVKGWKSGMPAGRPSIASAPSKISSMLEWITSRFDPSAKISTSNSRSICKKSFPPWGRGLHELLRSNLWDIKKLNLSRNLDLP